MAATKKGSTGTKARTAAASTTKAGAGAGKGSSATKSAPKASAAAGAMKSSGMAAPKKAAAVKLNDRQRDFLGRIHAAGEGGYAIGPKAEQRTIDALMERKLVKRGLKDKATGIYRYTLTRTGQKHHGAGGSTSGGSASNA